MKKILILMAISFSTIAFGQEDSSTDYFVADSDTTFCSNLNYTLTVQSYLSSLEYTDLDGNKVLIEGRKKVPNVTTLFINGQIIDRIPQKVEKPDGYVKFASRVVDGKLIVNYYESSMTTESFNSSGGMSSTTTGILKFFIRMPDGTYYDINKGSHMKKYIIPYLQECSEFVSQYKGDYSKKMDEFIETIELYNSLCD